MGIQLSPKWGTASQPLPQFSAHDRCGQTAGWIKMPIGMEVGLSPGELVLDGNPPKREQSCDFQPMSLLAQLSAHVCSDQMAGCIRIPLGMEVGLGPRDTVRWGPNFPPSERGSQLCNFLPPQFLPMSIVAKRSPISAIAEVLSILMSAVSQRGSTVVTF